jgi:hypothetical protein
MQPSRLQPSAEIGTAQWSVSMSMSIARVRFASAQGTPVGWVAGFIPKPGQRKAIRDGKAWGLTRQGWAEFIRVDELDQYVDGLDNWGPVESWNISSKSYWMDPVGRKFSSLREAMREWM